jgi:hypothetical protein
MSQMNQGYPQFNFSLHGPAEQYNSVSRAEHQSRNGSQQWAPPRSVQHHNLPSPAASVRSAATSPVRNVRNHTSYHLPRIEDNIDPSLPAMGGHLAPPGHVSQANYNIERSSHDEPWTPLHLITSATGDGRNSRHQASTTYKHFRRGPSSAGSVAAPVSDSGYNSQSVISTDASRLNQSYAIQGSGQRVNIDGSMTAPPGMVRVLSDQRSQHSRFSSRSGQQINELACPQCPMVMKCRSDYK